jgi:uncharacterized repeat protein (TIGR03803 family)
VLFAKIKKSVRDSRRLPHHKLAIAELLEERQLLTLTIDVRAADGSKSIQLSSIGQVVNLQVWAEITDPQNQPTEDGLQEVDGSFLSTNVGPGPVAGNLAATLVSPFNALSSQNGTSQDLNADGNLDVGSNNNASVVNFFFARSQLPETSSSGTIVGNALEFEIGTLTYTATHLNFGGEADINFRSRADLPTESDAVWREDNQGISDLSGGGVIADGTPFVITAPPAKLVFTAAPTTTVAGSNIDSPNGVQVSVEDAAGNLLNSTDNITLALSTNPGNDTLHGTLTQPAVNGIATFPDLVLTKASNGYGITASDNTTAGVAAGISSSFNITAAAPAQVLFVTQPLSTTVGAGIDAPAGVEVTLVDSYGNAVTTPYSVFMTLQPNGSALTGNMNLQFYPSGVATFNQLTVTTPGLNYTLTANVTASLTVTSQPFNISSPPAQDFRTIASLSPNVSLNGGFHPAASLYIDSSGNIFGTTTTGGIYGDGTVFEIAEPGNAFSTLISFTGSGGTYPGSTPEAGLISDGNGNLFGTTEYGGTSGDGTVFELAGPSHNFSTLLSLTGTGGAYPGANPQAGLNSDGNGNLFGTTSFGGTSSDGTVFELTGPSHTFSTLLSFTGNSGTNPGTDPEAGLASDANGNLIGTTYQGGASNDGTVFELAGSSRTFSSLFSFTGTSGTHLGANPQAGLAPDNSGDLFGTTYQGGTSNDGTVFELVGSGHTFSSRFSFTGNVGFGSFPGEYPMAGLVSDGNGNLFGTTQQGGNGIGTIFELAGFNHTFSSVVDFAIGGAPPGGYWPEASLISDGNGNLFGTTWYGGTYGYGTVFENPASSRNTLTTLVSFAGSIGYEPADTVFIDSSGNIFGTTTVGGEYGDGSVFEITEPGGVYSTLVSFTGTSGAYPGYEPVASLSSDGNGNLFGTTELGGASNDGTVFELAGPNFTFSSLVSFTGFSGAYLGAYPKAGLTSDGNGNLFGTTYQGGTFNVGTIFELAGPTHAFSSFLSFSGAGGNGVWPQSNLTSDGNGNLFGTTDNDDANGTIFELAGPSHIFSVISNVGSDASVISDGNGNLFGTTAIYAGIGGPGDYGTVFELVGPSHVFSTLFSFIGASGPYSGADPVAGLTSDGNGNLFGTTAGGGASNNGTVFELAGPSHTFISLLSFNISGVAYPYPQAGLTSDGNGNLFGTTFYGGPSGYGSVFELTPSTKLSLANTPSGTTSGAILSPIQVNIEQSSGSIATGDSSIVTLSIQSGPTGASLGGTTSVQAVNGVATFTNLSLSLPGNYTLIATDGSLSSATSNSFVIQPGVSWTGTAGDQSWSNPGNWSNDLVPTSTTNVTIGTGFTVQVGSGTYSVDSLTTSSPIDIATGATLLLFGPSTFASSLTIDNGGTLKVSADPVVLAVNGSAFTDNGTIDLGANDMIIHNGNITQIGQQIISSLASTKTTLAIELNDDGMTNHHPLMTIFDGQTVTNTDVLVKYTYFGDTNLSGTVDANDYIAIDNGFNEKLTGWNNGDFNYDGVINGDDYTLIDNAFNTQAAVPLATVASPQATQQLPTNKAVTNSRSFAATNIQSILPLDADPTHRRKSSLANEIFDN